MRKLIIIGILGIVILGVHACKKLLPGLPDSNAVLAEPMASLTETQLALHLEGDEAFAHLFSTAEGLGPIFVQASCESCHAGDGMGSPENALTRFGRYDGGTWDPMLDQGGPQLQHRAIAGYEAEQIPVGASSTEFIAPNVTGMGFLEAVEDTTLLALADPLDADGDGISGILNYVDPPDFFIPNALHIPKGGRYIGRFGRKAQTIDLLQQTVGAYREDMGITSDFLMEDPVNYAVSPLATDKVADPEVPASVVNAVVFYLQTLEAPRRRDENDPDVIAGSQLFKTIGCNSCHVESMTTGASPIEALNKKVFHAYTDLLLHDMGPELDDGFADTSPGTTVLSSEWRTTPLWGIGLQHESQGGVLYLLHDGRALSIAAAIQQHGGEGAASRSAYNSLSSAQKSKIEKFLLSL